MHICLRTEISTGRSYKNILRSYDYVFVRQNNTEILAQLVLLEQYYLGT